MAHLLSFDPTKALELPLDDAELAELLKRQDIKQVTERELFEAFWIGYKMMDSPPAVGAAILASMEFGRDIRRVSRDGGSLQLDFCPGCMGRSGVFSNRRTIDSPINMVIEKSTFEYIQSCFARWQNTVQALRPYFYVIHKMLEAMGKEDKTAEQWKVILDEREKKKATPLPDVKETT